MEKYLVLQVDGSFKEVYQKDYESTYQLLKENVGGHIEHISFIEEFDKRGIDLWINEESKLLDFKPTVILFHDSELVEILNGNIVFSRINDDGETLPLNDDDIKFIKNYVGEANMIFTYQNLTGNILTNKVVALDL